MATKKKAVGKVNLTEGAKSIALAVLFILGISVAVGVMVVIMSWAQSIVNVNDCYYRTDVQVDTDTTYVVIEDIQCEK